jgi:glucokinase
MPGAQDQGGNEEEALMPVHRKSKSVCLAGIEIGGTKIQVVVGTPCGRVLQTRRFQVNRRIGAKGIQDQLLEGLRFLRDRYPFRAIGVAFGGPIDWRTGRVFKSHHIPGWNGFPLSRWLQSRFGVPVFADNDANVAALAEARAGAGRGRTPVFYMTVGSGIGGGVVVDGRIYHGRFPGEVEIGHTRIPVTGLPPSRWPILETMCSGWSLDRMVRSAARSCPRSVLGRLVSSRSRGGEARFLLQAKRRGDPEAARIWDDLCRYLALSLSHVVHLFHPEILVLGGGVTGFGEPLRHDVARHLKPLVMQAHQDTYRLALAQLKEDAMPVGALILAAGHSS